MPDSPLPRRGLGLPARPAGSRAAPVLATAGAMLLLTAVRAGAAPADDGDHGDIRIHKAGTAFTDERDERTVCGFHLAAVGFDTAEGATWAIERQPPGSEADGLDGTLALRSGAGHTLPLSLPDGAYKLTWRISGGSGIGRYKTFGVDCGEPEPAGASGSPGTPAATGAAAQDASAAPPSSAAAVSDTPPSGDPPTGGSASPDIADVSAMGTATAVGLVAVSTAVYFRLLRRRSDEMPGS